MILLVCSQSEWLHPSFAKLEELHSEELLWLAVDQAMYKSDGLIE
jgi:hypothetical protein